MNLVKKVVLGAGIIGLPLVGTGQISNQKYNEIKDKLGVNSFSEMKNLGHGYWTGNDSRTSSNLKLYNAIQTGEIEINGKTTTIKGKSIGYPQKESLEKIDDGDYIITNEELKEGIKETYAKEFEKYAMEKLNVTKGELVDLESGYKTSMSLKEKLNSLVDISDEFLGLNSEELYKLISEDDNVIAKEEIIRGAKAINNYLNR